MDANRIIEFLNLIGCRGIKPASRVVRASCPFEYRHSGGFDKHPSFAIKIVEGDESTWSCFTCNKGGLLEWLVDALDKDRRLKLAQLTKLYEFIIKNDRVDVSRLMREAEDVRHYTQRSYKAIPGVHVSPAIAAAQILEVPPPPLFPEEDLMTFSEPLSKKALNYLKGRGVTDESMALWEMRFHVYQNRVILPLRDVDRRLVGLSGRSIHKKPSVKMLHLDGFPRGSCLYGEHLVVPGHTGILVEGQFDVIALWQYGYRYPVAIFGTGLAAGQIAKIVKLFTDVIILTDSDERGQEAAEKWEEKLKPHLPVRRVNMLEGKDPGDIMEEGCLEDLIEILGPPTVDNPNTVG